MGTPDSQFILPPGPMVLGGHGWNAEVGGNCPVQADGEVDGHPFYFRARGATWEFCVAGKGQDPVDVSCGFVPGFIAFGDYGDVFEAGWMPLSDAALIIARAVRGFRVARAAP